jgi:hypothetical protein
MTENVRKLIGVAAMAALVVVGVAVSSGDDTNFTRNGVFAKLDGFRQLPEAQQDRLAPAFAPQAASKDSAYELKNVQVVSSSKGKTDKAGIWLQSGGTDALGTGKTSVLAGRGVDGKGGTSSIRLDTGIRGKTGKAGIWLQNGGVDGVADRIAACVSSGDLIPNPAVTFGAAASLKNVILTSYTADVKDEGCSLVQMPQESQVVFPKVGESEAGSLATCMESKVGDVFLKSHIELSAAHCVATFQSGGTEGVADRIGECASGGNEEMKERAAPSIIAILIALFSGDVKDAGYNCQDLQGNSASVTDGTSNTAVVNPDSMKPLLLAECMESKVGGVLLKSHTEAMAADCVATVMPALLPERAKRLGTYWQTQQQLARIGSEHCWPCD